MKLLYHRLYIKFTAIALLLVFCQQAQAQDVAMVPKERMSLLQYMMQERPVLAGLATKAGLTPLLSDNSASFTILAPPDAELKKLHELPAVRIRAILSGHILKGAYLEKDFKDGATIETFARTKVNICRKRDYILVDGVRIQHADSQLSNGVIHSLSGRLNL
jgi:uncharacterized surface protein with fasciclin (FAS1) repeats